MEAFARGYVKNKMVDTCWQLASCNQTWQLKVLRPIAVLPEGIMKIGKLAPFFL